MGGAKDLLQLGARRLKFLASLSAFSPLILVTGAFGFIGSHLVEGLLDLGEEVVALSHPRPPENNYWYLKRHPRASKMRVALIDVRDYDAVRGLLREHEFSAIYHLAAVASHRLSVDQPHPYLDVNFRGTLNILEAARTVEPSPKIVFASSSSVYGDNPPPLREDMEPKPKGPYALSKLFGERLCAMYHELYGLECPIVRYFNVVGERCRGNIVFRVFAQRIVSGEPVRVNGRWVGGEFKPAERDFTYVGDAVEGTLLVGEKVGGCEVFNLGFGRPVSVLRVAELLMKHLGKKVDIVFGELKPHESLVSYSDNSKARKVLGWTPKTDIGEIIKRYAKWFLEESGKD